MGVHLVGGVIGTLLIGFLSTADAAGRHRRPVLRRRLESLGDQAGAAGSRSLWTGVFTTLIALAIKYTLGWRIREDDEVEGIDFAQHGETAYDLARDLGSFAGGSPGRRS